MSLEQSCHVEIAGTAPKVKPSLASPNWEQLLTTHKSVWKGQGTRERRWAAGSLFLPQILILGQKNC